MRTVPAAKLHNTAPRRSGKWTALCTNHLCNHYWPPSMWDLILEKLWQQQGGNKEISKESLPLSCDKSNSWKEKGMDNCHLRSRSGTRELLAKFSTTSLHPWISTKSEIGKRKHLFPTCFVTISKSESAALGCSCSVCTAFSAIFKWRVNEETLRSSTSTSKSARMSLEN